QIVSNRLVFRNGVPVAATTSAGFVPLGSFSAASEARARRELLPQQAQPRGRAPVVALPGSGRRA
ncbi:MAG TPA: hypothetical protein VKQ06_10415, partial [Gammaproteobacteria bacterium]|nr:hypothetical protein [Gammaproteobacteria bacterium]